jgi:hypothetical protein
MPDTMQFVARTMQMHHDHFVQLFRDTNKKGVCLSEKDTEEYDLAMLRERQGLVYPLKKQLEE